MDNNQLEKEKIYEWGVNHTSEELKQRYFPQKDASTNSYFHIEEKRSYLVPYGFETLPELTKQLHILWENEKEIKNIEKTLVIAAMKNKPENLEQNENEAIKSEEKLPQYIYNF